MNEILGFIVAPLAALITGVLTWFFTRRKNRAEAWNVEMDAVLKAVGMWREIAVKLDGDVKNLTLQMSEMSEKLDQISEDNRRMSRKLNEQQSKSVNP